MPHMDGFQVMQELKAEENGVFAPILILTANNDRNNLLRAFEMGARDFVSKPFDIAEVKMRIKNMLEVRLLNQQVWQQNQLLEETVRERTFKLIRTTEELKTFLKIAAHDLQEPLRKILLFADHLHEQSAFKENSEQIDYLARLQKSVRHLKQMIGSLHQFSSTNLEGLNLEPTDLEQLLNQLESEMKTQLEQTQGKLEFHNLPKILADKNQMKVLFQNIIHNALKFHQKEDPPKIQVSCQEDPDDFYKIAVKDNGIGFDKKFCERIFRPLERLQGRDIFEGAGMGLAICREIVERHRGTIYAESVPSKGTTFYITLPKKQIYQQQTSLYH